MRNKWYDATNNTSDSTCFHSVAEPLNEEEIKHKTIFYTENTDKIEDYAIGDRVIFEDKEGVVFWVDDEVHCITDIVSEDEVTFNEALDFAKEKNLELPAQKELIALFINKGKVNKELKNKIKENWLWSSTEHYYNTAWILRLSDGYIGNSFKGNTYTARCSFSFNPSSL